VGHDDVWPKNAGATYQRVMNLIFHDLLGIIMEVYIDDVVIKSAGFDSHIADLCLTFERMRRYGLRMNSFNCAFGVSTGRFLGFIVHENGIEVDPKKIEAIRKIKEPTCKRDVHSLLGKVNYLRRFVSNLAGRVESLLSLVRLKHEADFAWGQSRDGLLKISKSTWSPHWYCGHQWQGQGIYYYAGEDRRSRANAGG
jgi:hypothetical protein